MLPSMSLFEITIDFYRLFFALGLITVPIFLFCMRKSFGFNRKQAAFYSIFTLAFGYLSAMITAWLENSLLLWVSSGEYDHFEKLRNYGIPIFLPIFLLIYCFVFRDRFRKLSDYIAPCVYSVMTCVKIGCTFSGCCYGEPDPNGLWNDWLGYRTFPVQPYDALSSFVIVIICLLLLRAFRGKREGLVYPIGGMLFALTKGYWENYRVHSTIWEKNFLDTGWTFWQFWMLNLFIGCLLWLIAVLYFNKKEVPDCDGMEPTTLSRKLHGFLEKEKPDMKS